MAPCKFWAAIGETLVARIEGSGKGANLYLGCGDHRSFTGVLRFEEGGLE